MGLKEGRRGIARGDTLFWTAEVAPMQILLLRENLYIFNNISIISGVIQID